jgi:peptidoglycan/LPS O-acetylase OafA/YrhL
MTMRTRKLIGTVLLLLLILVYALLAVAAAVILQMQNANKAVELLYYVVAGTLWVIPAGAIIWWMQRPDRPGIEGKA